MKYLLFQVAHYCLFLDSAPTSTRASAYLNIVSGKCNVGSFLRCSETNLLPSVCNKEDWVTFA